MNVITIYMLVNNDTQSYYYTGSFKSIRQIHYSINKDGTLTIKNSEFTRGYNYGQEEPIIRKDADFNVTINRTNNINDIESITLSFTDKNTNEFSLENKLTEKINYVIKKRNDDINALRKDRDNILKNIETLENTDDNKQNYKDLELLNEQIRNHLKEINNIKEKMHQIEFEESIEEYLIKIPRNTIKYINDLPNQKEPFSLFWEFKNNTKEIIKPKNITKVYKTKTININSEYHT